MPHYSTDRPGAALFNRLLQAQRAKHALSSFPTTQVTVIVRKTLVSFELNRETFEKLIRHHLDDIASITAETVKKAEISMADLDHVIPVGGSTRIPAVQETVMQVTGKKDLCRDIDPGTAVAQGAAMFAQIVDFSDDAPYPLAKLRPDDPVQKRLLGRVKEVRLIRGKALGVAARIPSRRELNGNLALAPVYPANAEIGQTFTERFAPDQPFMTSVNIQILEGDEFKPLEECTKLGEFEVQIAPRLEIEDSIEVTFSYDRDGIVHVTVRDLVGGATGKKTINII